MAPIGISLSTRQVHVTAIMRRPSTRRLLFGTLLVCVIGTVTALPLLYVVADSFNVSAPDAPWQLGWKAYVEAYGSPRTLGSIFMTFFLVIIRTLPALVAGLLVAYLLVRTDLPWKGTVEFIIWLAFFFPTFSLTLGWIFLMDPQYGLLNRIVPIFNIYSIWGITWVHFTSTTFPIMVMLLTPALRMLAPALEEAAIITGSSRLDAIRRIVVPLLMPTVFTVFMMSIIKGLEAFEIELLLGTPVGIYVYSTRIYEYLQFEPIQTQPAAALSTLFIVCLVLMGLYCQFFILRKQYTTLTGHGFGASVTRLGHWRYVVASILVAYVVFSLFLPLALLVVGSFMRLYGFFGIHDPFSIKHWLAVLGDATFLASLRNTLMIGIGTSVVGVVGYTFVSYVLVRTKIPLKGVIGILAWLPWGIPGILLGMALLWTFLKIPGFDLIYGTLFALILVRVIASMPLGLQMMRASLLQVGADLEEASFVTGAPRLKTFRHILLPLLSPTALTIGLIAFIGAVRDISTMVLLSNSETRPLSILMLEYSVGGEIERGAVIGVIVSGLILCAAILTRKFGMGVTPIESR